MPSQDFKRSDRIADLIKVEISKIINTEVKDPRVVGITVLGVNISPDMKKADIYISDSNSFSDKKIEDFIYFCILSSTNLDSIFSKPEISNFVN